MNAEATTGYVSAPIACGGCDEPIPYEAGPAESDQPTYGEWLATPLGLCYVRTHRRRECVASARERRDGRRVDRPLTREERDAAKVKA